MLLPSPSCTKSHCLAVCHCFPFAFVGHCGGGTYAAGRLNEGRVDLNRDFPSWWDWNEWRHLGGIEGDRNSTDFIFDGRQKETQILMDWILGGKFVLSANFHDGAVLVNYPWDNYHEGVRKQPKGYTHT